MNTLKLWGEHMNEFGAFAKEVAAMLDVNSNTLRRWAIELEKKGYQFERNEKEQRIYYKRDIMALKKLQHLLGERISMEDACTRVADDHIKLIEMEQTLSVHEEKQEKSVQITLSKDDLEELIERSVKKAVEEEREAMFKAFELKMNSMIEGRDQMLMESLRTAQETKQLLLATKEEQEQKKPRKGLLKWFAKE